MIRTLLIITGAGLLLCTVAAAGTMALGGRDLARNGWSWTIHDRDGDSVRFERSTPADVGPAVTRTLAWTGGDRLQVEIPGDIVYVQGAEAGVVVEGPQSIVERVRLIDGRLTMSDGASEERVAFNWSRNGLHAWSSNDELRVTVTAPAVRTFDIRGSADVSIRAYDQPTLSIDVAGSSSVEVAGKAPAVRIDISGSGDVRVGPTETASVNVSGSGDVTLTRRPARLNQDISGSGDVDVE